MGFQFFGRLLLQVFEILLVLLGHGHGDGPLGLAVDEAVVVVQQLLDVLGLALVGLLELLDLLDLAVVVQAHALHLALPLGVDRLQLEHVEPELLQLLLLLGQLLGQLFVVVLLDVELEPQGLRVLVVLAAPLLLDPVQLLLQAPLLLGHLLQLHGLAVQLLVQGLQLSLVELRGVADLASQQLLQVGRQVQLGQ